MSTRNRFALLVLAALAVTVACGGGEKQETQAPPPVPAGGAAPPTAGGAAPAAGNASISGKITFDGTVPPAEKVKLSADPKCAEMHKEGMEKQPIMVKDGGLANVFVYVKSGLPAGASYPAPTEPATIDQHGCNYTPHIVAMQTGQPLKIKNSDDTLHNIHPRPTVNAEFNIGQPRKGMESTKTFDKKEVMFPVGCDVHPWMRAYISVLDNPFYAVSKEDGTFEIKGLPPGDYEIEAYHEKLKTQSQKVSVKAGDSAKVDFAFKG